MEHWCVASKGEFVVGVIKVVVETDRKITENLFKRKSWELAIPPSTLLKCHFDIWKFDEKQKCFVVILVLKFCFFQFHFSFADFNLKISLILFLNKSKYRKIVFVKVFKKNEMFLWLMRNITVLCDLVSKSNCG